ncbi:spermidine/putrescine ABC transporter ATP-binding protein [Zavarzinia compransoris]|uniref:Spermidine/putrescine import ATP-binding protein PotA n=1 Tax=Zavarzinia compransoris TaxID=1264899 RepID=A0A317EFU5_9PROT|nr:spermidine/putrescine ABC transporter ATP-binding protein [Zavarzinia compransoris]
MEARQIVKSFPGGAVALDHVSIAIERNEFFTLLGPSGCGKTTLLRLIAGFEQPTAGEIFLDGQRIEHLPPFRRPINTVFQSYALFPHMTVGQNIAFGLEMQGIPRAEIGRRVTEMLDLVKLGGFEGRKVDQMSGGQQQRVALARALANRPKVLLLDEPLSALDLKLRKEMQIELKRLQTETGITFVFVTHDQEEALTMSDRIAVMSAGRILQVGAPRAIYETPEHRFVADFIGESDFLPALVEAAGAGGVAYRLASGARVEGPVQEFNPGASVSLSTRPERLSLAAADMPGGLAGTIEALVYSGTDTTFHVTLDDGAGRLRVREQNMAGRPFAHARGDRVAVLVPAAAVRAFRDFKD